MSTKTIELQDAQKRFMELVAQLTAGTEIILTQGDVAIARLVPIVSVSRPRLAGLHPGAIWTSDDFDEPLPETFWVGDV